MTSGLVYYSKKKISMNHEDLVELAEKAETRNKSMRVTGFLTFKENHFVQYIEGQSIHLATLMNSIRSDERHQVLAEFSYEIDHKVCKDWSMELIDEASLGSIQFPDLMINLLELQKTEAFKIKEIQKLIERLVNNWSKTLASRA